MLNTTLNRRPMPRSARWSVAAATLLAAAALTGLTLAGQTFSSLSGSIFDATNRVIPNATLRLTSTQSGAEYTIHSDATGRYEFVGLPPGSYTLLTQVPGFSPLSGTLTIGGQTATQKNMDVRLQVGSLEETLSVVDGQPAKPRPAASGPAVLPAWASKPCEVKPVGGVIRPPVKLRDAVLTYPEAYRGSRHTETVVLQALIGTDGFVREVTPVDFPTAEFANAAMDAVRQWQFSQTLLNCEPTDVRMKVTVRFSTAPPPPPPPPPPQR